MFRNFKIDNARRVDFEGEWIQIPKSKWGYLRDSVFYGKTTQDGEPTPDNPVDLVSIPSEFNLTVRGRNLFSIGDNYTLSIRGITFEWNKNTQEFRIYGTKTTNNANVSISVPLVIPAIRLAGLRYIIWVTGSFETGSGLRVVYARLRNKENNNNVGVISISAGTYVSRKFSTSSFTGDVYHFSPLIEIPEGAIVDLTFKIMLVYGDSDEHIKYAGGNTYPYRLEDLDGNLHELCSLPDGTRDEYDRDNGILIKRVKRLTITSGTEPYAWRYHAATEISSIIAMADIDNLFSQHTDNANSYSSHFRAVLGENTVGCYGIGSVPYSGKRAPMIYLRVPKEVNTNALAQGYIDKIIADTGQPIIFEYPLAEPQIIPIKQYGKTYDGQVWLYNQKPVQPEDDVANVFTDANGPMKFKAISYGG